MTIHKLADAADLLGVSDDTIRRWADHGRFDLAHTPQGMAGIEGANLAKLALEVSALPPDGGRPRAASTRNHMRGIVTAVTKDTVMAQIEMCCGPYRIVSLISREAADDLELEPGVIAVANIKSTNVSIGLPT